MKTYILTASGKRIDPSSPSADDIELTDIAAGLSRVNRFGGFTRDPYTVAEHSVLVAQIAASIDGSTAALRYGLLHDASEAYLGDIINPLKQLMPDYQAIEEKWMECILKKFTGMSLVPGRWKDAVKKADQFAFRVEVCKWALHEPADYGLDEYHVNEVLGSHWYFVSKRIPLTPQESEQQFLEFAKKYELT